MNKIHFNIEEEFWKPITNNEYKFGDIIDLSVLSTNSRQRDYREDEFLKSSRRATQDCNEVQNLNDRLYYQFACSCKSSASHIDVDNTGQLVLVSHNNGLVEVFNMLSDRKINNFRYSKYLIHPIYTLKNASTPIKTVKWYPFDNALFITAGIDGRLKVWDTCTHENVVSFDLKSSIYSSDFCSSPSKSNLICGLEDCTLRMCDLRVGATTQTFQYHTDKVLTVSWKPLSDYQFASGSKDKTVCIWDTRIGNRCLFCFTQDHGITENDQNEEILVTTTPPKKRKFLSDQFPSNIETEHGFSSTHFDELESTEEAQLYTKFMNKLHTPTTSTSNILNDSNTNKNPNSTTFFESGTLHTHSQIARNISGSHPLYICYSHDGYYLFSSGSDGMLKSWDMNGSTHICKRYGYQGSTKPFGLQFSLDHPGGILFHGKSHTWRAFDTHNGEVINNSSSQFSTHRRPVRIVKWNKHRHELYTSSEDGDIKIWKTLTNSL